MNFADACGLHFFVCDHLDNCLVHVPDCGPPRPRCATSCMLTVLLPCLQLIVVPALHHLVASFHPLRAASSPLSLSPSSTSTSSSTFHTVQPSLVQTCVPRVLHTQMGVPACLVEAWLAHEVFRGKCDVCCHMFLHQRLRVPPPVFDVFFHYLPQPRYSLCPTGLIQGLPILLTYPSSIGGTYGRTLSHLRKGLHQ